MPYTLAYKDRYLRVDESRIESDTSDSVAFASLPDNEPTLLLTNWTGRQFTKLLSALKTGAELMFPEEANEILWQLVKVVHQPIPFPFAEDGDCLNYPNYSGFISYEPANPFTNPDEIPEDYLVPPFMVNSDGDYPELFGYLLTDVFVPFDAITIDPLTILTLNYPTIKITVVGSGQIELDLLSVQQGGYVILKVGSPPNIGDIIGEIIIETGVKIIDLDTDSLSVPPETDIVIAEEINIEAEPGVETDVYLVFIPKLNDSLLPLGFGGGIRSVGLCGFEEIAESDTTVQDVRYNTETGDLEKLVGGEWEIFATCEQLVACAPEGGGGGGAAALTVKTYRMGNVGFGTVTSTTTTFADISGCHIVHTPTRSNMLVIAENIYVVNSAGNQPITLRMVWGGTGVGLDAREQAYTNSAFGSMAISDRWEVTPDVEQALDIQWKTLSGTMTRSERQTINITIIEWDELEDLFVQDIRVLSDGTLQKKIGGVWIDVSIDLATLFADMQSDINAAAAAAAAAQTTANTATTVNSSQAAQITAINAVNTAQGVRLDDIDLSIAGLNAQVIDHENRIDILEANSVNSQYWSETFNFIASDGGWLADGSDASYASGQGWQSENGLGTLVIRHPSLAGFDGRITHMKLRLRADNALGALPNNYQIAFPYDGGVGNGSVGGTGTTGNYWYKVENSDESYLYQIRIFMRLGAVDFTLREAQFLGKGDNPF